MDYGEDTIEGVTARLLGTRLDSQIASPQCRAKLSGRDEPGTGAVAQEIMISVRTGEPPEMGLSVSV